MAAETPDPMLAKRQAFLHCRYTMKTRAQKWGNSLAVRIPRSLAHDAHIASGSAVELTASNGKLIIAAVKPAKKSVRLESLVRAISKRNLHGEIASGRARGREAW